MCVCVCVCARARVCVFMMTIPQSAQAGITNRKVDADGNSTADIGTCMQTSIHINVMNINAFTPLNKLSIIVPYL